MNKGRQQGDGQGNRGDGQGGDRGHGQGDDDGGAIFGIDSEVEVFWALCGLVAIAVAFGLAAERLKVRWTWALAGLPLAALAWPIDPLYGATIGLGLIAGAGCVIYRENEDRQRGGQEAQRIRERLGLFRWIWSIHAIRAAKRARIGKGRLAIGHTAQRRIATVPFGATQGKRGFIIGAPGTGKTVDLAALASAYAADGQPVFCIDPKGDPSLEEALRAVAQSEGRPFEAWEPFGSVSYNPLARGGPTEIADKLLAGEQWTEPHYLRQAQRYLGAVLRAMQAAGEWPPTLSEVVRHFDTERADQLAERAGGEVMTKTRDYVDSLSQRTRHELGGVRDRLAVLAESELGTRLEPGEGFRELDLERALRSRAVVYLRLESDRFPLAAQMLGAAIVSDLVNLTGQLQASPVKGLVIVDEFAAIAADHISRLISRSRSAGLTVVLAAQTLADLDQARPGDSTESLRRQILANVDYVIAHRQSEPEAAETLAAMTGTRASWVTTKQVRSAFEAPLKRLKPAVGSRTPEREYVRHPDEFKRLGVAEAIVIEPARGASAARVRMWRAEVG